MKCEYGQNKRTVFEVPVNSQLMNSQSDRPILIAGGGTGGHIYPGVAIARAILATRPNLKVEFVGARGGLEEKIIPREGFTLHLIPVGKLHASVGRWTQIKTLLGLPLAFVKAWQILSSVRPQAVLGVGGFASGPLLAVAALRGFRTLIWEPNAHAGLANRWLARIVDRVLVVFEAARAQLQRPDAITTGLPVRAEIRPRSPRVRAPGELRVLVFGGSQGARFINQVVAQAVRDGGSWLNGVELVHQTGRLDHPTVSPIYRELGNPRLTCHEYLHDMHERYAWADVVVCRAGASTVAEIAAAGKAAVFVPLPTAADDHQRKNAEVLVKAGAAMMIEQRDLKVSTLTSLIQKLRDDVQSLVEIEKAVLKFAEFDAAGKIASEVLGDSDPTDKT